MTANQVFKLKFIHKRIKCKKTIVFPQQDIIRFKNFQGHQFFNLIEYLRKRALKEWEEENEIEELQESTLKIEFTNIARAIINLGNCYFNSLKFPKKMLFFIIHNFHQISDALEKDTDKRDDWLKPLMPRMKEVETYFGNGEGNLSPDMGTFGPWVN